jgi:Ca2+-binding EF-hand superfamily protein
LNAIDDAKVDAELEQADKRRRLKQLQPQIKRIFEVFDKDSDGELDITELCAALRRHQPVGVPADVKEIIRSEKLVDLFEFLDIDNSGTVNEDEFVQGVGHLAMSTVPVETTQTLNLLKLNLRLIAEVHGASAKAG